MKRRGCYIWVNLCFQAQWLKKRSCSCRKMSEVTQVQFVCFARPTLPVTPLYLFYSNSNNNLFFFYNFTSYAKLSKFSRTTWVKIYEQGLESNPVFRSPVICLWRNLIKYFCDLETKARFPSRKGDRDFDRSINKRDTGIMIVMIFVHIGTSDHYLPRHAKGSCSWKLDCGGGADTTMLGSKSVDQKSKAKFNVCTKSPFGVGEVHISSDCGELRDFLLWLNLFFFFFPLWRSSLARKWYCTKILHQGKTFSAFWPVLRLYHPDWLFLALTIRPSAPTPPQHDDGSSFLVKVKKFPTSHYCNSNLSG